MVTKGGLDLGGVDVLAAGNDHVLLAVDDVNVTVLVLPDEVTAVEPTTRERLGGGRLVAEIALHHSRTAIDDLADVAAGHVLHLVVDDAHLDIDRRPPDRPHLPYRVLALQPGRTRRHLRLPEVREDLYAGECLAHELERR